MAGIRHLFGIGLIAASSAAISNSSTPDKPALPDDIKIMEKVSKLPTNIIITKRAPTKVYHRFEEIPEITDNEAILYDRNEYTYVINADKYQKNGEIELKRILSAEVTAANVLSLIYRSEGESYIPQPCEDQIVKYKVDAAITSKNFVGPSQMDNATTTSFIKYLAARPDTRSYVTSLFKGHGAVIEKNAEALKNILFDENGTLKKMDDRKHAITSEPFKNLKLKYDFKTSYKMLLKNFPNKQQLVQVLEDYNLAFYAIGRSGKPKQVLATLALVMHLRDKNGEIDATRIPTFVAAAAVSSINWQGNGLNALSGARRLQGKINMSAPEKTFRQLIATVKPWVTGKSRKFGVDELAKLNIITPYIIRQYQKMELAGAENLARAYKEAVKTAEASVITNRRLLALNTVDSARATRKLKPHTPKPLIRTVADTDATLTMLNNNNQKSGR